MQFLKKYWYYSVILGLLLYIITIPKKVNKVYNVVPKQTGKTEKIITKLNDSIEMLNYEKKLLLLDNEKTVRTDTVFVKIVSKPKEIIVVKNEQVTKEVDCTEYYTDSKRDSIWAKRTSKKDNTER